MLVVTYMLQELAASAHAAMLRSWLPHLPAHEPQQEHGVSDERRTAKEGETGAPAGAAFAGLGFAPDEAKYSTEDEFAAFRKNRAGAYREFMGRAAAAAATGSSRAS